MTTTLIAPSSDTAIRSRLRDNEELAIEVFSQARFAFESEDAIEKKSGSKRSGRLGRMTFEFQTADTLNRNRRIYPSAVVKAAMDVFAQRVNDNVVFGNLDHPHPWDPASLEVRLSEACVKVVECSMLNDKDVRIIFDILDNGDGERLKSIIDVGGNPGTSQRAIAVWREPTDDEREQYKVPDDEWLVVAESLRLITYDIVSETGFADADGAHVTESRISKPIQEPAMDRTELQSKFPGLVSQLITEGRSAAQAEFPDKIKSAVEDAITQRKPQIVEEAVKPLNDKLGAAETRANELKADLEKIKPLLVKHGVVNEQITDAQAAAKIATLEIQNNDLAAKLKAEKDAHEALKSRLAALETASKIRQNLETISAAFKESPHHDTIVKHVAKQQLADAVAAMESAKQLAELIASVAPAGTAPAARLGTDPVMESLNGLLKNTPAAPQGTAKATASADGISAALRNGFAF